MIPLATQQEVGALIIGIFGRLPTAAEIDYYDSAFDIGSQPPAYMASILMSQPDAAWMSGQSEYDILSQVYFSVYNTAPDPDYINALLQQGHFNSAVASVVIELFNYPGDDPVMLAQRDALDQRIAEGLYPGTAADAAGGSSDAQAMFYLLRAPWQTDEIAHDGKLLNQGAIWRRWRRARLPPCQSTIFPIMTSFCICSLRDLNGHRRLLNLPLTSNDWRRARRVAICWWI